MYAGQMIPSCYNQIMGADQRVADAVLQRELGVPLQL